MKNTQRALRLTYCWKREKKNIQGLQALFRLPAREGDHQGFTKAACERRRARRFVKLCTHPTNDLHKLQKTAGQGAKLGPTKRDRLAPCHSKGRALKNDGPGKQFI
jgi:hypothetical protein